MDLPGDMETAWMVHAACVDAPTDWFFPELEKGGTVTNAPTLRLALALCEGCPVRELCLGFAVASNQTGIWGGTTDRQRKSMRAAARAAGGSLPSDGRNRPIAHGTATGYKRGCGCLDCRAANAAAERTRRQQVAS